ncbi:putative RNA methyltransferase [Leptospira kobayashii]|uniref:RNA methyltransferase n=1 Tax=Leptospira kobayashii TaxID=1917830 RepID=A0ABN6KFK6_9LEPT|nr:class I SAM-dependent RNA methyltransferase [Leptospira kobayashii]BDA79570.1 putative RNA methyltransferase [Leptospira kobayashii]
MDKIVIDSLTSDFLGQGIAPNGKKVSFPYALPGDELAIEITSKRRRQKKIRLLGYIQRAEWEGVLCEHFGTCGGCSAQHISYDKQTEIKFGPILSSFTKEVSIDLKSIPADTIYHYRSRMDFSVFPGPKIGLRAKGNFRHVVDVLRCSIQTEWANEELQRTRNIIEKFPNLPWDRRDEKGGLKYVTIRKAKFTDESTIIFTFTEGFETQEDHDLFLEETKTNLHSDNIIFCYNRVKSEVSAQGRSVVLRGKDGHTETIQGKNFFVPFDSFFQPNPEGFLPILEFIRTRLPENKQTLIDLFCGNGFFSLLFGKGFSSIHCFELTPSSIDTAKQLLNNEFPDAEINAQVANLFMDAGLLPKIRDGVLILDPPRAGSGKKVAEWIRDFGPNDVFYVSCNPESQKEDVKVFLESYTAKDGILIDPYPHTPHTESVIHFQRK